MAPSSLFLKAAALVVVSFNAWGSALGPYQLQDKYDGSGFFDLWNFDSSDDLSHGYVDYQTAQGAKDRGLVSVNGQGQAFIGVDHTTDLTGTTAIGRASVRIESINTYNGGLFIADIQHMPGSICGVWPALWTANLANSPAGGEIDIIEGINEYTTNLETLHTTSGCSLVAGDQRGAIQGQGNCDNNYSNQVYQPYQYPNQGCSVSDIYNSPSYGTGFNNAGGGVYAMEWTGTTIKIWNFPRLNIPGDITQGTPDPSTWGPPTLNAGGPSCSVADHFNNHQIVFDNTFCGDFAGQDVFWKQTSCYSQQFPTCQSYVESQPSAFGEAFWLINSVKVYQSKNDSTTTSSSSASSTSSATSSITSGTTSGTASSSTAGNSASTQPSASITSASATLGSTGTLTSTPLTNSITLSSSSFGSPSTGQPSFFSFSNSTRPPTPLALPTISPTTGATLIPPNNGGPAPLATSGAALNSPNNGGVASLASSGANLNSPNNGGLAPSASSGATLIPPSNGGLTPLATSGAILNSPNNGGSTPSASSGAALNSLNNGGVASLASSEANLNSPNNGGLAPLASSGANLNSPNNGGLAPLASSRATLVQPNNGGLAPVATSGATLIPPNNGGLAPLITPGQLTTSTAFTTITSTVTTCPATVQNCPAGFSTVIALTIAVYTTVLPASAASATQIAAGANAVLAPTPVAVGPVTAIPLATVPVASVPVASFPIVNAPAASTLSLQSNNTKSANSSVVATASSIGATIPTATVPKSMAGKGANGGSAIALIMVVAAGLFML